MTKLDVLQKHLNCPIRDLVYDVDDDIFTVKGKKWRVCTDAELKHGSFYNETDTINEDLYIIEVSNVSEK